MYLEVPKEDKWLAASKYVKHLFKVIDRYIIYLMLILVLLIMRELDVGLVDGVELNFDQSYQQFNIKKKMYAKGSS